MKELKNKVIIVTGAGNGIGKGIAKTFARYGAKIIIATQYDTEGLQVESEILAEGNWAKHIKTDVREEASIKNLISEVSIHLGRIDILINNAGITMFKSILDSSIDDWNKVIDTDLRGVFLCSKYIAQFMISKNLSGSIINISSNHAYRTLPNTEIYAAAKGGVNAMTRSMALSLGKYGIRVNTICPGFTDTHHYQTWLKEKSNSLQINEDVLNLHASHKISTPDDIANLAVFLASDNSKNITGADFLIDGGLTARLYHSEDF